MKPVKMKGSILSHLGETTPKATTPSRKSKVAPSDDESTATKKNKVPNGDDDLVYVNTPYKLNLKKLTKSQKEKLAKRRDDIPALYQDLSQSQTRELSNSCSNNEPDNNDISKTTISETPSDKEERPFSQVGINNENKEPIDKDETISNISSCELTPSNTSAKKKRKDKQKSELERIRISNVVGFEEHLKNVDTSLAMRTRKKVLKVKMEQNETENSAKRKRTKKNTEEEKLVSEEKNTPTDIIDGTQDASNQIKKCQVPALYPLGKVKPGGQIVIKGATNTVDLVKGPRPSSPFTIKDESPINKQTSTPTNKASMLAKLETSTVARRISLESMDKPSESEGTPLNKKKGKKENDNEESVLKTKQTTTEENAEEEDVDVEIDVEKVVEETHVNPENVPTDTETQDKDTETPSSELFENIITPSKTEYQNAGNNICRKVLFEPIDEEERMDTQSCVDENTPSPKKDMIVTSPIRFDTPTRNREFMKNTLEISPIKTSHQNGESTTESTFGEVEITTSTSVIINPDQADKSPDLFSDQIEITKETVESEWSTPVMPKSSARKSKMFLQGRGAQMMNLITPNSTSKVEAVATTSTVTKQAEAKPSTVLFNRSSSRISKMMVKLDSKAETEAALNKTPQKNTQISEDDIFQFGKNLPSPTASPRFGILRKRKAPDHADDGGMSPCTKRKRVNFSDPPVSCRKFIERHSKRHYNLKPKFLDIMDDEETVKPATTDKDETEESQMKEIADESDNDKIMEGLCDPSYNKDMEEEDVTIRVVLEPQITQQELLQGNHLDDEEDVCDLYKKDKVRELSTNGEILIITPSPEDPMDIDDPIIEVTVESTSCNSKSDDLVGNTASDNYEIETNTPTIPSTSIEIENTVSIEVISNSEKNETIIERPKSTSSDETFINESVSSPKIISNSENSPKDILKHKTKVYETQESETSKGLWKTLADKSGTYDKLNTCMESIQFSISTLGDSELSSILQSLDVKTIGDLSKLTGEQFGQMPYDSDIFQAILDSHNCDDHVIKPIRKIRPITISSPVRKTNKVSVIATSEAKADSEDLFSMSPMNLTPKRILDSPVSSTSSNSPSPPLTPPGNMPAYSWTSPTVRENVLDAVVIGGTVQDVLGQIKNVFQEKKCDPKPILQEYIGGLDMFTSPSTYTGGLRIHHVAAYQKWDDIFSDIVAYIGIKKVVRCLTRLKNVPQDVLIENLYKFISKDTNVFNMVNVLNLFDATTLFQAIFELMGQETSEMKVAFEKCFVPAIVKTPEISSCFVSKLSMVQLQNEVIERVGKDSEGRDTFLQKLNDRLGGKGKALVPRVSKFSDCKNLTESSLPTVNLLEILNDRVENGFSLTDAHFELLGKLFSSIPLDSTLQLFNKVIKTKYENK